MAIFKANVDNNYTVIPNKTAQDCRLSFEARGMLALLLSLPSDWQVNNSWLVNQSCAGRDKVKKLILELIENGYMSKQQPRNQKGKFTSNDYFVYATPVNVFAVNGETVDGLAASGESDTTKETVIEKKDKHNDQSKIERESIIEGSFNYWWEAYPKRVGKAAAFKAWVKITKRMDNTTVRDLTNHIFDDCKMRMESLQAGEDKFLGFDRLHPTTYLNQERYNDDI